MGNFFDLPNPNQEERKRVGAVAGMSPVDYRAELGAYRDQVKMIVTMCRSMQVTNDEENAKAAEVIGEVKTLLKRIETQRKKIVKPFNSFVKMVNTFSKTFTGPLTDAEKHLRNIIGRYAFHQEQQRRAREAELRRKMAEEQRRLEEEAKKAGFQPVKLPDMHIPARTGTTRTEASTVSTKMKWAYMVTDKSKLPVEYILPDDKAIKRAISAGVRDIPGVKIFEEPVVRVRTR